jgi:nanoRNase/pAp phosphatase (c-di-AMP/oligoRNAs hydrolase)
MNTKIPPNQQLSDKIKSSSNILITVAKNPSIDALASAIALTLALDKLEKHATAVFSGDIPKAINFLEPEKTFEDNADSLRDFVISLDKDKADRLRFKPDGDMVRIYITPYKTKLSADDLSFSDGEFNIELVIAIGVDDRSELDDAIASHGRILHSATTATIKLGDQKDALGTISWQDSNASSYSEMVDSLVTSLSDNKDFVDSQIATAILTGLVSATDQFRNAKTSASVMTVAADLMGKGANQQLIASELSGAEVETSRTETLDEKPTRDGLAISHEIDDSEKWNPTIAQAEQVEAENTKIANSQSQEASAEAYNQLGQIASEQNPAQATQVVAPSEPTAQIPAVEPPTQIAPVAEPAGTAELDNLIANATSGASVINDLKASVAPSPSSELSHGEPYVNDSVSPLNSSLLGDDSNAVNVGFAGDDDRHITIEPLTTPTQAVSNPTTALPMPPDAPFANLSLTTPTVNDGLPPVPPLAPSAADIASLTASATNIANIADQNQNATTPQEPVFMSAQQMAQPSPMINQPAPAPVVADPTQFKIPGM